jgi:hypothetical protein
MNVPGFTAEASFRKRTERYYQKADVVASRNGAGILPAREVESQRHGHVKADCLRNGGVYWKEGPTTNTYGCINPNGSGIVCGGTRPNTCTEF